MSRGSGMCWELMNNVIFRSHFLTEVTGSAWLLPKPILLVLVSTVFESSWVFFFFSCRHSGQSRRHFRSQACPHVSEDVCPLSGEVLVFRSSLARNVATSLLVTPLLCIRPAAPDKVGEQGSPLCWQNIPKGT